MAESFRIRETPLILSSPTSNEISAHCEADSNLIMTVPSELAARIEPNPESDIDRSDDVITLAGLHDRPPS